MSYSQQELEALLQNDEFVSWVLSPRPEDNAYWHGWMQQHPDRKAMVEMIRVIREAERDTTADSRDLADQIWHDLQMQVETPVRRMNWKQVAAAVIVIVMLGVGGLWIGLSGTKKGGLPGNGNLVVQKVNKHELMAKNTGNGLQTIYLMDGTRITLSPKSAIHYSRLMRGDKREVKLEGEAFFEVARDASRPFMVYSGGIVTKVLGTSFRVKGNEQIVVAVRSGKVMVSRQEQSTEEYILLPNEQVVFNSRRNTLQKVNVTDIAILANPVPAPAVLNYDESPVSNVLDELANMYGINIQYDHHLFAKCRVTVSLDQASFYEKLTVLCKVIGANYEMEDEAVYITGQGCN